VTFGLLEIVQLIALYHAGLMGVVILLHPRLRGLGLLCIGFALHMGFNLGISTDIIPSQYDITSAFGLLYGPFFYLFVRDLCFEQQQTRWLDGIHTLPALLIAIIRPEYPIQQIIGFPSLGIYIFLAMMALRQHRDQTAEIRSDDDRVSLRWVELALVCFSTLALLDITRELMFQTHNQINDDLFLGSVLIGVLLLLSFMAMRALEHEKRHGAIPETLTERARTSSDRPNIDPEIQNHFLKIDQLIREDELWREARLSLVDVSKRSGLKPRIVSTAINSQSGQSFSGYINSIRVEAVNVLMSDPVNASRTVIELAYEAGFNSKSAFNRIYRDKTGNTPTEVFSANKNS